MIPRYMISEPAFPQPKNEAERRARLRELREQLAKTLAEIESLIPVISESNLERPTVTNKVMEYILTIAKRKLLIVEAARQEVVQVHDVPIPEDPYLETVDMLEEAIKRGCLIRVLAPRKTDD